ncbi:hypothetical protein [Peribacillus simplex]|uniref:Uncharacterized protein n=1 Tax=Peribacillus simplex TaxID=1478 RepID=A0AAW7IDS3_9BACI|nr:hypothetical protein [Peribacillus simplex]MDM5453665.1 hypothetical protein [Peribacillus simplex]
MIRRVKANYHVTVLRIPPNKRKILRTKVYPLAFAEKYAFLELTGAFLE